MESQKIQLQQITQKGKLSQEAILDLINSQINCCLKQKLVRWEKDRTQTDKALDANIETLRKAKQNIQGLLDYPELKSKDITYSVNIEISTAE